MHTRTRTITALTLIVALFISAVPISFSPKGAEVRTTHAQLQSIGGCIANLAAGAISSYFSTSVPTSPGTLNAKECLDGVAKGIANQMKQRILDSTIQWAKTGFEGDPLFLVNEKRYLQEIADQEALAFINDLGRLTGSAARGATEGGLDAAEDAIEDQFNSGSAGSADEFGIPNCRITECSPDQENAFEAVAGLYQRAYPNAAPWQLENDSTLEIRNCPELPGSAAGGCNSDELQLYYEASDFRRTYQSTGAGGFNVNVDINSDEIVRNVERALVEDQRRTFRDTVRCRLCEDYDEGDFYRDFEGGWNAWFKSAEPGSNPFGSYITSSGRLAQQKRAAQERTLRDAQRGDGFLSSRACAERVDIPDDGRVGSGSSYCKSYETETPPTIIAGAVKDSTGSDVRELELSDEINEVFSAIIQGLITRIATEGLRSLDERDSSGYNDPFSRGSTSGSTNQSDPESARSDFIDSFSPGRSAQTDTQRVTSNEFPEGAGEGLSGGAPTLQQVSSVNTPATINLSSETFSDWVYFGLTNNFGSEVERKNIATPQIGQGVLNIPVSSNISVVAEDVGFDFSWTDGYPQSQGSGESQGLGIASVGERIEFSVAGGDREQELTLYLGATQALGELRISFPGSGQDDVVANVSSQNGTAAAQTVTIRFNAQADESLRVSYEAQELFPDTNQQGETIAGSAYVGLYAVTIEDAQTLYTPEDPTLIDNESSVVLSGGSAITQTGPQTLPQLLGGSWWPGQANTEVGIGSSEYISVPLRTADDFSGNGRILVSGDPGGETGVVAAAFSKYPGDFTSMYETDKQNDRHCFAGQSSSIGSIFTDVGSGFGSLSAMTTELYWHIAIPPIVGDSPGPVSSSCQLKPNTRYYLNILCRRVDDSGNVTGSCSDIEIETTAPGTSQQRGAPLRVQP